MLIFFGNIQTGSATKSLLTGNDSIKMTMNVLLDRWEFWEAFDPKMNPLMVEGYKQGVVG